jgi:hypothetical protein
MKVIWNDLMFGTLEPFFKPPTLKPTLKPTISPTVVPSTSPTNVPTPSPSSEPSAYFTKAPAKDAPTDFFSKFETDIPPAQEKKEFGTEDSSSATSNVILCVPSLLIVALSMINY